MNNGDPASGAGNSAPATSAAESDADRFYSGAERRIVRYLFVLAPVVAIAVLAISGAGAALGFAIGAVLAAFNFRWLHTTARNFTASLAGNPLSGTAAGFTGVSLALGLVARLALVTVVGYAIFRGSLQSFYGYLGGLTLPIAAVFLEAFYEAWVALRRDL